MSAAVAPVPVVHWFDTVESTMDEARTLALAGVVQGTAAIARVQRAGRGRNGRTWVSPPGNLHATVVLRPGGEARRAPELGFVTALAVAEAVDAVAGCRTTLKWPNDVLCGGAKLAGILMERLEDGAVLAGIGINLAHCPPGLPYPVTSLSLLGCAAGPDAVLSAVLERLAAGCAAWQADGFAAVLARWAARGPARGDALQVRLGERQLVGSFAGLAPDGALLLDTRAGQQRVVAGEVLM